MADEADIANDHFNTELSRTINRIRKNTPAGAGPKNCMECGEDIPDARRQLGFRFCVACAETRERRQSLFAEG